MAAVTVSRSQGRLIAVKQVPAIRTAEIEREAGMLKRLEHPGLVRFVDLVETADGGRALHTEFVSSDTWATRPLTDPAERAAGMAALAAVVADLHHLGVAHMQLAPGHVLHGEDDRPVLCGLTLADEATPENRHVDLAALAELCHDQNLDRGSLANKLESLADAARAGRLSARELARRLDLLAAKRPTRTEPIRAVGGGFLQRLRPRVTRRSLITSGAVAIAVVVAFGLGSRRQGRQPAPIIHAPPPAESPSAATAEGPMPADPSATGALPQPLAGVGDSPGTTHALLQPPAGIADAALGAPAPPAGPETTITAVPAHEAAAVLEHGGRRYAVGATGDFVATGDWDCDGEATAAIVRPSTGDIVMFDAWPGPAQTVSLPVRWSVDSPTGAEAVPHGQCDLLRVHTTAGSRLFNPVEGQ